MDDLAWSSLAAMIGGQLRQRPAGWLLWPKVQVEGAYRGCHVRASRIGNAPATLKMDGHGGRGLRMKFRNEMHTGGRALTGDVDFDSEVDWEVSHIGYANLWLGPKARKALCRAEFWEVSFNNGVVSAKGSTGTLDSVMEAMSRLARRGMELEAQWARLADELGGSWRRAPFCLGNAATIELLQRDVHVTITPDLDTPDTLTTTVRVKASHSTVELVHADLTEGELLDAGPGQATARLTGLVDDARRLHGLVDSMTQRLMPTSPYR